MSSWLIFILWYMVCCFHNFFQSQAAETETTYPGLVITMQDGLSGVACPAISEIEKKFNDEVSLTKNSLFVQDIGKKEELRINICRKSYKAGVVYDHQSKNYQFGYEIYQEKGNISFENWNSYNHYWPVDALTYKIMSIPKPVNYTINCTGKGRTQFIFTAGHPIFIFQWVSSGILISLDGCTKQIVTDEKENVCPFRGDAGDYREFMEQTVDKIFQYSVGDNEDVNVIPNEKDLFLLDQEPTKPYDSYDSGARWNAEAMGTENGIENTKKIVLKKSFIFPPWYLHDRLVDVFKSASINFVPVSSIIADGQLMKVNLYTQAVMGCLDGYGIDMKNLKLTCGVSGIMMLEDEDEDIQLFSLDENYFEPIPVPKIIYRFIEGTFYQTDYNAVIIVHNDVREVLESERMCAKEDEVSGWDMIKNEDYKSGLTYVCYVSRQDKEKLGILINPLLESFNTGPLELDAIQWSEYPQWEYSYPLKDYNKTKQINDYYESLLEAWEPAPTEASETEDSRAWCW